MARYWRALVTLYVYHDGVECFHSLSNVLVTHQQVSCGCRMQIYESLVDNAPASRCTTVGYKLMMLTPQTIRIERITQQVQT